MQEFFLWQEAEQKDLLSNVFHRFVIERSAQERNIQDGEIWLHNGRERTSRYNNNTTTR
jgi:hypothetical protein